MAKKGEDRDMMEEAHQQEAEASTGGDRDTPEPKGERKHGGGMHEHHKRKHGGGLDAAEEHKVHLEKHKARKRGGHVEGKKAKERPDRRARGGGMADTNPMTAAGNMSTPDYEGKAPFENGGMSKGPDKSPYKGGSHRRPG